MKTQHRALFVLVALALAGMACNLPSRGGAAQPTQLPAPNQTLTALFAITPIVGTATPTLPPVITSTPEESGGGIAPTATQSQPVATNTTAPTAVPPTAVVPTVAITQVFPTAAPTNTRPPAQATATQRPLGRSTVFQAKYLSTPPTIDGDWGEWKTLTTEYSANYVTWGAANRANDDDLAGSFHVGWDNNNLYMAVKVRDDRYVQNATGENIYLGDSLEILLDTNLLGDYYYDALSPDDFQLGINPGRSDSVGTREAYLWFPSNIAGARSNVTVASRLEDGLYRVEFAIPWSVFETTPAAGKRFGFVLSASDNDNTGENLQQSMVSSSSGRRLTDPTTWGELQLVN